MKNSNSLIKIYSFLMILSALFISSRITAQQHPGQQLPGSNEYSDEELKTFLKAAKEAMPLQQESQIKMVEEIEEKDLSVERFNIILEAHTRGQEVDASEEELESFNKALDGIQDIQIEYEDKIVGKIENEGLSAELYQAIFISYQQDPELRMRIDALLEAMEADGEL